MRTTKRVFCLLLALCCMIPMVQGLSLQADAYASAKPLPELTGNKGQDVANIAISQLGYGEDSRGGTVYGAWWSDMTNWGYDYTRAGWCSMFAMWCAHQAGAGMNIAFDKRGAVPDNCMNWLLTNASGDTTFSVAPAPGDFIFFSTGSSAQHVAIVVAYDKSTNKVTFVGGNQGNKVTQFTMSYTPSAKYGSQRIIAIGRPKYGSSVIVPTCSCDDSFAGYYQCITQTDSLNMRGGHGTGYSVVGSIPPGATVYVSKAQGLSNGSWAHVEYNGIKGYCSMQYLKRLAEYNVEVLYDEHTGEVAGANVEIYDHVTVDEMTLTLPEQFNIVGSGLSPMIHVTAKNTFILNLEIPLSGDFTSVKPVIFDGAGQAVPLDDYTVTDVGICVSVAGTVDLQLIYEAPSHEHSYSSQITTQPSCETPGVTTYRCACGDSYTQSIAATGHTEENIPGWAATCVEPGRTDGKYCSVCEDVLAEQNVIPALSHNYANEVCTRCGAKDPAAPKGVTVSGNYISFGNAANVVTVQLIPSGAEEAAYTFTNEAAPANAGTWSVQGVAPGAYTVRVTKSSHVAREYTVTVDKSDLSLDVTIYLLGDVTGDGRVNFADYAKVLAQAKDPSSAVLTDYALKCGDVNGDARINFADYAKVLAQAKGNGGLW